MITLLEKYKALAEKAMISKNTLRAREMFVRLVKGQPDIDNFRGMTRELEIAKPEPGVLITFEYSAKHAKKLPFWDRYPLVLVTEVDRTGWQGLNLHYLHPLMRARILHDHHKNGVPIIDNDLAKLCHKRYLAERVRTKPREFPEDLWDVAIQMPFEAFEKRSKSYVWKDTSRKK